MAAETSRTASTLAAWSSRMVRSSRSPPGSETPVTRPMPRESASAWMPSKTSAVKALRMSKMKTPKVRVDIDARRAAMRLWR